MHDSTKRKLDIVLWNKLCSKKDWGGLGIKKLKEMNMACLMKLVWCLQQGDFDLWA